jgi:hypothetical protein
MPDNDEVESVFATCPWDDCQNQRVAVPVDAKVGDKVTCDLCLRNLRVVDMSPPTLDPSHA